LKAGIFRISKEARKILK